MAFAALSACNGPTKHGKEARSAANTRMSIVSAQVHYDQAKQSFETGQFERAGREIRNAISRYPDSANYYVLNGRIQLETHQLEAALESFKTATEKDAKLAEPHYFSGIVFQRWSNDEKAFESYSKAYELDSSNVQYLLASAESLIAMGEFQKAADLIAPRVAFFEHNAALRQLQGQIALLQGDSRKAATLYAEARMLSPDDDNLLEQLMWAQYAAGMYGQCHDSLKRLQQRISDRQKNSGGEAKLLRSDLTHLEARCLNLMGRGPEARELYIELTSLRPADTVVWTELGSLAWELGDYRRLATCSVQLIALAPDRYEGYMFKGLNERQKGNFQAAADLFRESARRANDVALPYLLLGQTLEQIGQSSAARDAYADAVRVEPTSPEAAELLRRLTEGQRVTSVTTQ